MTVSQNDKAIRFRALHQAPGAFVIPNPWDAGSARILAALGFQALAVDLVQPEPGHGLDVVEDAELQSHTASVGGVSDPMIDCRCHPWEGEPWPSAR